MAIFSSQQIDVSQYGQKVFEWEAHDSHPHERGRWWIFIFSGVLLLMVGVLFFLTDYEESSSFFTSAWFANGLMVVTLLFALWLYAANYQKQEIHTVSVYQNVMVIDRTVIPVSRIRGYWTLYDRTTSILHIVLIPSNLQKSSRTIVLQMGEYDPTFFRQGFSAVGIEELQDQQESVLDQWIRVLKL